MKRKLHFAITLVGKIQIVILDKPTCGLNPESCLLIWDVFFKVKHNKTNMMVNLKDTKERLPLLRENSNINETQIQLLNTTGNKFANYLITMEGVGYSGGLQS